MIVKTISLLIVGLFILNAQMHGQDWRQKVDYRMEIDLDVESHNFTGTQRLFYYNNSPDTLNQVYYHLYFNAFQPGSMMDVRSRNLPDPDRRVGDRIFHLKPEEEGHLHVKSLKLEGKAQSVKEQGTVLEVLLSEPILPHSVVMLEMEFYGQVPIQIRRNGRDNAEGIAYSMGQWYPKMAAYDRNGWHADPYVAREFYAPFGNFDVKITLDEKYTVGATGHLENASSIGRGYSDEKVKKTREGMLTWHFKAQNVHDFVWAADPDYTHTTVETIDGITLHFFYQDNRRTRDIWEALPVVMQKSFEIAQARFGKYPYRDFSFIQGGDYAMEYPQATLVTGERNSLGSLVGSCLHEIMHSWFQGVIGTDERYHGWMDEGFASYGDLYIQQELRKLGILNGRLQEFLYAGAYDGYKRLVLSGLEEPLSTHADHYNANGIYNIAVYSKGNVLIHQLEYIVGKEDFERGLSKFFNKYKFKHPTPSDFFKVFEEVSGMQLDWYHNYFVNTTKFIDYSITSLEPAGDSTRVDLERKGHMPMPVDLEVRLKDGSVEWYTIPLVVMRNEKVTDGEIDYQVLPDWQWTNPTYTFTLPYPFSEVDVITIDPTRRLADIDLTNNIKSTAEN